MKWKVMTDKVRIKTIFDQHFGRSLKNDDMLTAGEARQLACKVLYDYEYREWRTKQLETVVASPPSSK